MCVPEKGEALADIQKEMESLKERSLSDAESTHATHTEEITYLKAEVESAKVKLQEMSAQYQAEKEALARHADADRAEVMKKMSVLKQERENLLGQVDELQAQREAWQSELAVQVQQLTEQNQELSSQKNDLTQEVGELREKTKILQSQQGGVVDKLGTELSECQQKLAQSGQELSEMTKRHNLEIQEKIEAESQLTQRAEELETRNIDLQGILQALNDKVQSFEQEALNVKDKLEKQVVEVKQELEDSLKEKTKDLEESAKVIQEKDTQFKELQERFSGLKDKAQVRIHELKKEIAVKEETLSKTKEDLKNLQDQSELNQQAQFDYETKIKETEVTSNDLNIKIKELDERLAEKEDKIAKIENNFEQAQQVHEKLIFELNENHQKKTQEMLDKLQLSNLQCKDLDDEIVKLKKIIDSNRVDQSTTKALEERSEESEKRLLSEIEHQKKSLEMVEKDKLQKLEEMKRKYLIKLKEFQEQNESRMTELKEVDISLKSDISNRDDTIRELQLKVSEKEALDANAKHASQKESAMLLSKAEECESRIIELQCELEAEKNSVRELTSVLSEKEVLLSRQTSQLKEAEDKMCQLENTHQSEIEEHLLSEQKLKDTISATENSLSDFSSKEKMWISDKNEMLKAHEEDLEKQKDSFSAQIKSQDSVLNESLQKSESQNETEAKLKILATTLKRDKNTLTSQVEKLEKDIKSLEKQLKKAKSESEKAERKFDVDIRALTLQNTEELERLKNEYETHIEELQQESDSQLKQVVKEAKVQIAEKDRDFQDTFREAIGWLTIFYYCYRLFLSPE